MFGTVLKCSIEVNKTTHSRKHRKENHVGWIVIVNREIDVSLNINNEVKMRNSVE